MNESLEDIHGVVAGDKAASPAKPIVIFHICSHCNQEYQLDMHEMNSLAASGQAYNFGDCPHCNKRNDLWIRIGR